ncbi:MAG: response regulator [Ignavibacteriales bacterium]|nr:MAG: response regulator [Ignavibacteriales bacterium]
METNNKPKVLIVDDEKGLRLGTKRLLESEGYFVVAAENGTEGIEAGTTTEFDLAIIDLKMPDIEGTQVLKKIREVHPNTVCYIATAYASYETAIESTKLGAYSYIPKPFTPEELLQQLKDGYNRRLVLVESEKWKREREERLLEVAFEKTRLNTIINSITDGLLVVNKNGEAVLYNPSALNYLNLPSIAIEEKIIDKLPSEISSLINKFLDAGIYENKSYSSQIEIKPNRELFVEATSSPVPHPDGSLAGVVVVMKNITEMKKLEFLKSQFVSMVSHELKAPVAAVYGYLKLLVDDSIKLSQEQEKNFIKRSQIRLDNLLKMVNDLLDISRMEMKTAKREIISVNLAETIKSVIELFQFEAEKREVNVLFNYDENLPLLNADLDEITRLFTNLISNAIKYNKVKGLIEINIHYNKPYIITEIKDNGIGLKPDEKNRLFQEFFRAKNENTREISGTGLGLSIVKRIVDSYAGKIEVESEFNVGTMFRVFLPLKNENNTDIKSV